MSGHHRAMVGGLLGTAVVTVLVLIAFASASCPVETPAQPCPDARRNVVVVIGLAAFATGLLVTPFAFLGEVVARRRIIYRGAWGRAARRGVLAAAALAILAGLRLGSALNVPIAIFVVILAAAAEWLLARRDP